MKRIPIRLRLTLAFAAVMALVLVGVGMFLYLRLEAQLNESLDTGLRSRATEVAALVRDHGGQLGAIGADPLVEQDESFAEVIGPDGTLIDATPQLQGAVVLDPGQLAAAAGGAIILERDGVPGLEAATRVLAAPATVGGGQVVVVVGSSLGDRDESLDSLARLLAIGGPIALLLASLAGYWLAGAALRPVEAMRSRAAEISANEPGARLPVSEARDEVARLGETLNQMLARLEAALARERRFVDDASHELRTPLALHRIELELALRHADDEGQLREAIASSLDEVDRLIQLAEDLLVVARSDTGEVEIKAAPFPIGEALTAIDTRFDGRARRAGTTVDWTAPPGLRVEADRSRIEQALTNLVENALRHGRGPVELEAVANGAGVELHVRDHGDGFPPGFIDRAFERFSRADEARTESGSGLGLAIVDSIARSHGGSAHARNRPEGGADVWISLPPRPPA